MGDQEKFREVFGDLVEDEDLLLRRLKELVAPHLRISKGRVVILNPELPISVRVVLYALGKYIAHGLGVADTDTFTVDEVSRELGIKQAVGYARLSELRREAVIDSPARGEYVVVPAAAEKFLRRKLGDNNGGH